MKQRDETSIPKGRIFLPGRVHAHAALRRIVRSNFVVVRVSSAQQGRSRRTADGGIDEKVAHIDTAW